MLSSRQLVHYDISAVPKDLAIFGRFAFVRTTLQKLPRWTLLAVLASGSGSEGELHLVAIRIDLGMLLLQIFRIVVLDLGCDRDGSALLVYFESGNGRDVLGARLLLVLVLGCLVGSCSTTLLFATLAVSG